MTTPNPERTDLQVYCPECDESKPEVKRMGAYHVLTCHTVPVEGA